MKSWVRIRQPQMRKARIEIIPMIDTIFFLLVFFMFTSLSMVRMTGMGIGLPKPAATAEKPPQKLVVTVDRDGRYAIGDTPIAPAALRADLQGRFNANPNSVVIVNVEGSRTVQNLISVMDSVNLVRTPDGHAVPVMIAKTLVDASGDALATTGRP